MQLSFTVSAVSAGQLVSDLRAAADLVEKTVGAQTPAAETVAAPKRGRPPKEVKAAEENDADESFDLGDSETEELETPEPAPTLEDVISAFRSYAKKHSKEKAGKVLAKYKLKSVRDLPEEKYAEVIETLNA